MNEYKEYNHTGHQAISTNEYRYAARNIKINIPKFIKLNVDEIDAVINIRKDATYCTFVDGYKIVVTKV